VSYKPNVSDVRETAAESIIMLCKSHGANVNWHDEIVKSWNGETTSSLQNADIAIVVTKHDSVKEESIRASAPYVFDATGTVKGVVNI
jgi:UDP-N-acetyl-D-glucosamine dehydrogenase